MSRSAIQPSIFRNRAWLLFFGAAFLVCAIVIVLVLLRRHDLVQDSRNLVIAAINNDPDELFSLSPDFQAESVGLAKQKYRELWQALIQPRFSKFHSKRTVSTQEYGEHQAVSWVRLEDDLGHLYDLEFAPFATDNGGGMSQQILHPLLEAWILDYVVRKGEPTTPENILKAYIQGATVDRPTLAELNVVGLPQTEPGFPARTWEQLIGEWRAKLAKLGSKTKQDRR